MFTVGSLVAPPYPDLEQALSFECAWSVEQQGRMRAI
jgi:hypothetical protein